MALRRLRAELGAPGGPLAAGFGPRAAHRARTTGAREPELAASVLPELAAVPWRGRASAGSIAAWGRGWTLWAAAWTVTFSVAAAILLAIEPLLFPVSLGCLAHAWAIAELHAHRGAITVRPKGPRNARAEPVAQGLLGDLLDHAPRTLQRETGLALEPGRLGTWLVGEEGALLVRPGGRRVHCFCVHATDRSLPPSDRIAHLLLALRTDEQGFATVANHAFSGAIWRLRRRLRPHQRPALAAARRAARGAPA